MLLLPIIWAVFGLVRSTGSTGVENVDLFLEVIQNVDHSVNPCDNFYLHVCAKPSQIILFEKATKLTAFYEKEGKKLIPELKPTIIEELFNSLPLVQQKAINSDKIFEAIEPLTVLQNMRSTSAIFAYMNEHKIFTRDEYKPIERVSQQLLQIATHEVQTMKEDDKNNTDIDFLIELVEKQVLIVGQRLERKALSDYSTIQALLDKIFLKHFETINVLPITKENLPQRFEEFAHVMQKIFTPIFQSLRVIGAVSYVNMQSAGYNSYNSQNTLSLLEQYFLPSIATTKAAQYGHIGFVVGHEFSHSFYNKISLFRKLNSMVVEKSMCSQKHTQRVIEEYSGGQYYNASETWTEDTADIEGIKLAYKTFLLEFGETKDNPVMPGLNVTNAQMFFYAVAAGFCGDTRRPFASHSSSPVRINGPISLIRGFHDAFKCTDGDRMKDIGSSPDCNLLGPSVRR